MEVITSWLWLFRCPFYECCLSTFKVTLRMPIHNIQIQTIYFFYISQPIDKFLVYLRSTKTNTQNNNEPRNALNILFTMRTYSFVSNRWSSYPTQRSYARASAAPQYIAVALLYAANPCSAFLDSPWSLWPLSHSWTLQTYAVLL